MMFLKTCCVLRIRMMSIATSCRRGMEKLEANYCHVCCGGGHQLVSAHYEVPYNHGILQLLGKSCFFHTWQYSYQSEAANLTGCSGQREQFVLPWSETFVAEGYSALSQRKKYRPTGPDTWAGEVKDTDGQGGRHAQSSRGWYQLGKKEGRKACRHR